jgi:hypothetical protein
VRLLKYRYRFCTCVVLHFSSTVLVKVTFKHKEYNLTCIRDLLFLQTPVFSLILNGMSKLCFFFFFMSLIKKKKKGQAYIQLIDHM